MFFSVFKYAAIHLDDQVLVTWEYCHSVLHAITPKALYILLRVHQPAGFLEEGRLTRCPWRPHAPGATRRSHANRSENKDIMPVGLKLKF